MTKKTSPSVLLPVSLILVIWWHSINFIAYADFQVPQSQLTIVDYFESLNVSNGDVNQVEFLSGNNKIVKPIIELEKPFNIDEIRYFDVNGSKYKMDDNQIANTLINPDFQTQVKELKEKHKGELPPLNVLIALFLMIGLLPGKKKLSDFFIKKKIRVRHVEKEDGKVTYVDDVEYSTNEKVIENALFDLKNQQKKIFLPYYR